MAQSGGDVLGEGGFGCIVDSFVYDKHPEIELVQKIVMDYKDLPESSEVMDTNTMNYWKKIKDNNETSLLIGQLIITTYPDIWPKYFAPVLFYDSFPLIFNFEDKFNKQNISHCLELLYQKLNAQFSRDKIERISKYFALKIFHIPRINGFEYFDSIVTTNSKYYLIPSVFIREIKHILKGFLKLTNLNILHRDIKPENIMLDFGNKNNIPSESGQIDNFNSRIIDFDFAMPINKHEYRNIYDLINKLFYPGTPGYKPPECYYFDIVVNIRDKYTKRNTISNSLDDIMSDIISEFTKSIDVYYPQNVAAVVKNINETPWGIYGGRNIFIAEFIEFVEKMQVMNLQTSFNKYFIKSNDDNPPLVLAWDVFSLGSVFLDIYLAIKEKEPSLWSNELDTKITYLLKGMVNGNPFKRLTLKQSLEYVEENL
jgi:serine/threonine protein kinase